MALLVLAGEPAQHPVGQVVVRVGLLAHAYPQAGKLICAQVLDDAFQPVVSAGGAAPPDAQFAHSQRGIVQHYQHMVRRDLVKSAACRTASPDRFI